MVELIKYFLFICTYSLIECSIRETLSVQKLDPKFIERKRQDTLEMCRMFNSENDRLREINKLHLRNSKYPNPTKKRQRIKREAGTFKTADTLLALDEAKRVESIVDKLYDEITENGQRVTYRQKKIDVTTTIKVPQVKRRLNFAPAQLLGPAATTKPDEKNISGDHQDTFSGIPWHKNWKHAIIPYFIDPRTYDNDLSESIVKAFDYFEKTTCFRLQRLREKPIDTKSLSSVEWLYITNPMGIRQCVHSNERKENIGVQLVIFGYDCMSKGEIVHEIMHVLGFSHEHTRPDRDQFITILWDNIKPGYKKYFETRSEDALMHIPYDYSSVLHYPQRAFSKNGQVTIFTESNAKIGQREGLSDADVEKVSIVFGHECMERNRQYLTKTCPSVVKSSIPPLINITQHEIEAYFEDRLWPYGIVNYQFKDDTEFSIEEIKNIKAVIKHIEKETCIEFRDVSIVESSVDSNEYPTTQAEITKEKTSDKEESREHQVKDAPAEDDFSYDSDDIKQQTDALSPKNQNKVLTAVNNTEKHAHKPSKGPLNNTKILFDNLENSGYKADENLNQKNEADLSSTGNINNAKKQSDLSYGDSRNEKNDPTSESEEGSQTMLSGEKDKQTDGFLNKDGKNKKEKGATISYSGPIKNKTQYGSTPDIESIDKNTKYFSNNFMFSEERQEPIFSGSTENRTYLRPNVNQRKHDLQPKRYNRKAGASVLNNKSSSGNYQTNKKMVSKTNFQGNKLQKTLSREQPSMFLRENASKGMIFDHHKKNLEGNSFYSKTNKSPKKTQHKSDSKTKYTSDIDNNISVNENNLKYNSKTLNNATQNENISIKKPTSAENNSRTNEFRRVRRSVKPLTRRHANHILIFTRSTKPGCRCPQPGRPKGDQVLEINADCFNSVNDLLHLFVHLLGLEHQHNMHDRDSYLHILWDNLSPELKSEMAAKAPPAASVGFPYDYQSVMHYPWLQIKNGVTNIMYPIWNDGWAMGHWQGLSSTDVNKLNILYHKQCRERKKLADQKFSAKRY